MTKSSKRFADWVTASRADPFFGARWKLTLLYVALITVVVVLLSSTLYAVHQNQLRDEGDKETERVRVEGGQPTIEPFLERSLERLGRSIVYLDVGTILIAGILSFWLAGRTLRPIRDAVLAEQRFLASAAHDLRTPLTVMRTEIEVALRDPRGTAQDAREVLSSSLDEVGRMAALVEELLQLAASPGSRSGPTPREEPQDLADLVTTTVERLQGRAAEAGATLTVKAEPVLVAVDARRLERAVANVVENALKFAPAGQVTVSVAASRTHADVVVQDSGVGIAPEDLPHVTEPFYRGDSARTTPGSGLGLAIVRQVVTEARGSLDITSSPGAGTRVRLRFPRI